MVSDEVEELVSVDDGARLWTASSGVGPAVALCHGGPGMADYLKPLAEMIEDLATVHRWDQRGAGRSDRSGPYSVGRSVADLDALRVHFGHERWALIGHSWGANLAILYAQRHPDRVTELVLASVVTTTAREIEWVTRGVGPCFPEAWRRFRDGVPAEERGGDLVEVYHRLLHDDDPVVRARAAADWCAWEDAHVRTRPGQRPDPRYAEPAFRARYARLVTHYWRHRAWLEPGQLTDGLHRLTDIPAVLVHGRRDLSAPLDVPQRLAAAWPQARLVVVDEEGHAGGPTMTAALRRATDGFAAKG